MVYQAGTVIRFTYLSDKSQDRFKEVLVLNPNWRGHMHAIDLKRVTPAEQRVLLAIFDPKTKERPHPYPLVNDILRRMDPVEDVKNPMSFYARFCKPFIRNAGDCYRKYDLHKIVNVTVVKHSAVEGHVINPKPLFHK